MTKDNMASPQVTDEQIARILGDLWDDGYSSPSTYNDVDCKTDAEKKSVRDGAVAHSLKALRALLSAPPAAEMPKPIASTDDQQIARVARWVIKNLQDSPRSALSQLTDAVAASQQTQPQEAKPVAADGWQVVPKVPTLTMLKAMDKAFSQDDDGESYEECYAAAYSAALAAAPQEQAPADKKADFYHGVIASLAVLTGAGYAHGSVYHDEIVRSVGEAQLYAVAEDGDYAWAGLDPSKRPAIHRCEGQRAAGLAYQ